MIRIIEELPALSPCRFCHGKVTAAFGRASTFSCTSCGAETTFTTPPFFADPKTQREHEMWRATLSWNG